LGPQRPAGPSSIDASRWPLKTQAAADVACERLAHLDGAATKLVQEATNLRRGRAQEAKVICNPVPAGAMGRGFMQTPALIRSEFDATVSTGIYLCDVCSCQEILRRPTCAQALGRERGEVQRAVAAALCELQPPTAGGGGGGGEGESFPCLTLACIGSPWLRPCACTARQ
jgi:hypothetical protein